MCLSALLAATAQGAFPGAEGRIAFSTFHVESGEYSINTVLPDGSGLEELAASDKGLVEPSWSPDGRTIVYAQNDRDPEGFPQSSIWTMNADGSVAARLADGSSPSFSPDGRRIVYVAGESIRSIALNGRKDRRQFRVGCLGELAANCVHDPIYSPDGKRIVYERRRVLWSASLGGTERERLTPRGMKSVSPDFSPDGRLIAFRREHETAVMRANGERSRVLPNQPSTGRRTYRPLTDACPGLEPGSNPLDDPSWQPLSDPGA